MANIAASTLRRNTLGQDRTEIGGIAELPPALDPARYPIIAEHFYAWRPVGAAAAEIVSDPRYRRQAKRQHARGLG